MARYDLTRAELADLLAGQPRYRVDQVWEGLYRHLRAPGELTTLPRALREQLAAAEQLAPALREVACSVSDRGATRKWLWELADGARVETVLMEYDRRATVCVSSQAGCAMGCGFCATGQAGFARNLTAGEIVEQVVRAGAARAEDPGGRRSPGPDRPANVVFMGMGEPLANYPRVWAAVERLHDDLGISARHITISTVGIVPGIRRLAAAPLPVNLAVSLHAANDRLRDHLVPINRRYPLPVLLDACRAYLGAKGRRLSFEWALIAGVNDRAEDAAELAAVSVPLGAHVNLIPLNPTPGWPTVGSAPAVVRSFRDRLISLGANATVRRNRGTDIDAACGQLAATGGKLAG
ncbi:MAG TPA: 23S rRNA (adenine(2503)-C(2))-methyltransferase RlmN [Acidimicrobiales bacterium]|nr:23S rRNA (adenine(2503)-C(2))-methyltransferase RlmN [Acidimicrobiales bacterium]